MTTKDTIQDAEIIPPAEAPASDAKKPDEKPKVILPPQPQLPTKSLETTPAGLMTLTSISDQLAFAQRLIDQRMISETFETPSQVVIGIQWAISMRLEPVSALRMMYVVGGRPSLWGDGPLMMAQRSGELAKIEEFFIEESGERICVDNKNLKKPVWAAVTRLWRKGDDLMQEDFFSVDDLRRAGIDVTNFGKKKATWMKFERIMMRYRARTMGLKTKFADCVSGMNVAEYHDDFSPEMPAESKQVLERSVKSEINDELGDVQ